MIFNRFSVRIILLILLIVITIYAFFLVLHVEHLKFTLYGLAVISVIEVYILIRTGLRFNERTNHFLETFIINEAFPRFRNKYQENSFKDLERNLYRLARSYSEVKAEKEVEHLFLENLIGQINVGILVYDNNGKIHLKNKMLLTHLNFRLRNELSLLKEKYSELYDILTGPPSAAPKVLKFLIAGELKQLSVKLSKFIVKKEAFKLAIIHDISYELDQEEIDSWQKLIKILRHEIINSVTPITTVASTLVENFNENNYPYVFEDKHYRVIDTTYKGLSAIEKRGEGLIQFIKNFKELSSTLKPELESTSSCDLLNQIKMLVESDCRMNDINLVLDFPKPDIVFLIDEKQIIQVIINLVKNAIQALKSSTDKKIEIQVGIEGETKYISITDNGEGIEAEDFGKIFIPFYTTREGGSGIGLSICRQIMFLHKGSIQVKSQDGYTCFTLRF